MSADLIVSYTLSSGLVLSCPRCGVVAEYLDDGGGRGDAAMLAEINDDALEHVGEHDADAAS